MFAWQFCQALHLADMHGWPRFISMQDHYNLLYREEEREMFGLCRDQGIGVIPWSPLARGRLARAWETEPSTPRAGTDEVTRTLYTKTEVSDRLVVERVGQVAAARGVPQAQIALAWVLANPVVTAPIVGATKPHHLEDALAALSIQLSADEIAALEARLISAPGGGVCVSGNVWRDSPFFKQGPASRRSSPPRKKFFAATHANLLTLLPHANILACVNQLAYRRERIRSP